MKLCASTIALPAFDYLPLLPHLAGMVDASRRAARRQCRDFLEALLPRMESHGTVLCFAPIKAKECCLMVNAIDHPASIGGRAGRNRRNGPRHLCRNAWRLEHFHADEPDWGRTGEVPDIDRTDLRRRLGPRCRFRHPPLSAHRYPLKEMSP